MALRLLRLEHGQAHARSHRSAQPRRRIGLGERGRFLRSVQSSQGRPPTDRDRDGASRTTTASGAARFHQARRDLGPSQLAPIPPGLRGVVGGLELELLIGERAKRFGQRETSRPDRRTGDRALATGGAERA